MADPAQCAAEAAAALPRLCALQQWLAACLRLESDASSPGVHEQVQQAAHHLAEAAAADRPASGGVAAAYLALASALQLLGPSWADFSSAGQLDHWCGAANSALHRLPHLLRMVLLGGMAATPAALLAQRSVAAFITGAQAACSWVDRQVSSNEGPRSSTSAALAALAPRLRALHGTACRLVHWATSGAASEEATTLQEAVPQLTDWRLLLRAVDGVFSAACAAQRCVIQQAAKEDGDLEARRRQAMGLAQWEAVSALGEHLAPAPLWAERGASPHGLSAGKLVLSLVDIAVACEPTLSLPPGLLLAFEAAVRAQFERRHWRRAAAEAQRELEQLKALLQATSRAPYLTAHLISSGLLHELLALVLPSSSLTNEQVRRFAGVLNMALATLVLRGEAYVVGTCQLELQLAAASNTTAAELRRLQPWKPTFQPSIAIFPGEELLAYWLDSLRWQAYSLAQALHQMQRSQPTEQHAAYAASQRRCAYLRCASLGVRAQYCSGFRVSRYCSRADQLADWHAGHRRACCMVVKFAEAEAAEQAQQQQARAEQQRAQLRQQAQQAEQQRQAQQAQRAQQPHWLRRKQQRRRR